MTLEVWTSRISSRDPDRLDITRKSATGDGLAFAPSWSILRPALAARREESRLLEEGDQFAAFRATDDAWERYVPAFAAEMRASYRDNRAAWDRLLAHPRVVLCCYCTDPSRCHRTLLADMLGKCGAVVRGEIGSVRGEVAHG